MRSLAIEGKLQNIMIVDQDCLIIGDFHDLGVLS